MMPRVSKWANTVLCKHWQGMPKPVPIEDFSHLCTPGLQRRD